jgi:hypothetical protein
MEKEFVKEFDRELLNNWKRAIKVQIEYGK